ncbi:MAG: 2-C-methyl-D-erythritol 2,4-cyclodiphosphate synthase [Deltaproteobacteria bacterium]|nr:2-C-methyl-D-erythritol 2,4-cyclodiphosphate synthase [Deltaproteobacteria bacterium]MBW2044393.1 2-C-methyl-D-erythritol 2,4-cyclodiphosphate synthase [Deltaproteobacteria bacterium]MBW2301073.1 2-C-methyl-D-erythritol 2,4-cyclodiphosphate synthase [Deltaproteobacteria bacterium]
MLRVGFGYDAHRLVPDRTLVLGGVEIPGAQGLLGHSDADVLTHAIIDALLGALCRGDIGQHFPDKNQAYKNIRSVVMLKEVIKWVAEDGYRINNIDSTIVAEEPKLAPHLPAMRKALSKAMGISIQKLSIKATTAEGMGFCGRKEGMEAFAFVSLVSGNMEP